MMIKSEVLGDYVVVFRFDASLEIMKRYFVPVVCLRCAVIDCCSRRFEEVCVKVGC